MHFFFCKLRCFDGIVYCEAYMSCVYAFFVFVKAPGTIDADRNNGSPRLKCKLKTSRLKINYRTALAACSFREDNRRITVFYVFYCFEDGLQGLARVVSFHEFALHLLHRSCNDGNLEYFSLGDKGKRSVDES